MENGRFRWGGGIAELTSLRSPAATGWCTGLSSALPGLASGVGSSVPQRIHRCRRGMDGGDGLGAGNLTTAMPAGAAGTHM